MAEIPLSTKNMQSVIVHVPSLICGLLMISSLVRAGHNRALEASRGALWRFRAGQRGNIMTLQSAGVNRGKHEGLECVRRAPSPAGFEVGSGVGDCDEFYRSKAKAKAAGEGARPTWFVTRRRCHVDGSYRRRDRWPACKLRCGC